MTAYSVGTALFWLRPADAQDLQQKLAAARAAAARNQQTLRSYSWIEKTELLLKSEVKATKVDSCRYGPDDTVQKTAVVTPPPPQKKRGLSRQRSAEHPVQQNRSPDCEVQLSEARAVGA